MKQLSIWLVCTLWSTLVAAQDQPLNSVFFEEADAFFKTYSPHGSVRYQALHHHPKPLLDLLEKVQQIPVEELTPDAAKAFYLNAYNLLVIKTVVQNYPIASPNELTDFWDGFEHIVSAKAYTLEALEALLWTTYQDPLLHFALVKGAKSSVPAADFAYRPDRIQEQLETRAISSLNNNQWLLYNKDLNILELPRLFFREAEAFQPNLIEFINQYRVKAIPKDAVVVYKNENWQLNGYHTPPFALAKKKNKKQNINHNASLAQVITLPKGVGEIIDFNSIYSVGIGTRETGSRNTYFNSYLTAYYGLTGKLDIGMSMLFRSSRERDPYTTSPFKVLDLERTLSAVGGASTRFSHYADWGLSHVGFQVRFAPFRKLNLSFEQGLMFPIKNLPYNNTVDESLYSITQVYYQHSLAPKVELFLALTYWQPIRTERAFKFQIPLLRGFINYFVTPRFSIYATSMYFLEWGAGVKYLLTPKFEVQVMYSHYLPIQGVYDLLSPGASNISTYNMGLRYRI